ncbi:hypothetical protein GE061_007741 [Apolygus lucorum]|uniref:Uncharacterized protein n=1 Tax=Apolygus lucorum TaxID=248454 RepID=A0A8S9WQA6_APOLU|nr:hypothetical protein GE061_007741 [Apolygus lucorum]
MGLTFNHRRSSFSPSTSTSLSHMFYTSPSSSSSSIIKRKQPSEKFVRTSSNVATLTPQNRGFLKSLGLTVLV